MIKRAVIVCLAFFPVPPLAAQRAVEFEGRYWVATTHSRIRFEERGVGTEIRLRDDLGVTDTRFPEGRFTYQGEGAHRVQFGFTPIEFSGDRLVTRTLLFNGREYTVGARVVSNLEVQHLKLSWAWQFFRTADGKFRIGPLVEGHGFVGMRARLRAPDLRPPVDEDEEISAGVPAVGVAMDVNPHRKVNLFGNLSGMKLGSYGYFVHADLGVKVYPVRNVFFTAGYRNFNLHVKDAPDFVRIELRGPFVGGGFRF